MEKDYAIFKLGCSKYGIAAEHIEEIMPFEQLTTVPKMPNHLKGVIKFQDDFIPVINIEKEFGVKSTLSESDESDLVVLKYEDYPLALHVELVSKNLVVETENILKSNAISLGFQNKFLEGICINNTDIILLLDVEKLLY